MAASNGCLAIPALGSSCCMSSNKDSTGRKVVRTGAVAAAGAAAAYGGRILWQKLPAIMASVAAGQVGKIADKVRAGAVEGASQVADGVRENAAKTASATRGTAKKAASGGTSAARRTATSARKTATTAGKTGGSSAKSRARKSA
jgi:hypothetical protein